MPLPVMNVSDIEGDFSNTVNFGPVKAPTQFDGESTQYIYLTEGWSMISFHIDTTTLTNWDEVTYGTLYSIRNILKQFLFKQTDAGLVRLYEDPAEYIDSIHIIKDGLGGAYLPEWDFDGVGELDTSQNGVTIDGVFNGLQIKTSRADLVIKLTGYDVPFTTATTLNFPILLGWSVISFPSKVSVSASTFISEFVDKVVIMKDYLGGAIMPEWGFDGVGLMQPGRAYLIKTKDVVNGEVLTATMGNDIYTPPDEVDEVVVTGDDVYDLNDWPYNTGDNMTLQVPIKKVYDLIEHLDVGPIISRKIELLELYLKTISVGKNKNMPTDGEKAFNELTLGGINTPLVEFMHEFNPIKDDGSLNPSQEFAFHLNRLTAEYPSKNEPSGYSIEVQKFVANKWNDNKSEKIEVFTLSELLDRYISATKFSFAFYAYNSSNEVLVGRYNFFILGVNSKNIAFPLSGDDALASGVQGLVSNEIPKVYFFTGEKYSLCTFTLKSGTTAYASGKAIEVVSMSLSESTLKPF